ncbi:MAG: hypothetical protein ABSC77_08865 [Terracidiphilus sp.]
MKLKFIIAGMAFIALLATPAMAANTEETSLGRYVYQSKTLNFSLRIDADGIKDLTINDKKFPGVFPSGYSAVVSGVGVYILVVTDDKDHLTREIELIDRFDETGEVIGVAGFYLERKISSSGKKLQATPTVLVFQPKFTRIPIQ